ncbi:hypothetical protein DFH05DRAFT_1484752 [Lentinula detonsa]|uniref:F-box domain-containing protein n=1 Tax=Lentinula detonsa TaxID=2804962 RepID=A0A9W8TZG4_9AGAR|nr:hypothetical protein DFH05DRAFT_1484752 [Lentinula detonsa]
MSNVAEHFHLLLTLPTELIIGVLTELDVLSLVKCKAVCRQLHDIIAETTSFTYEIELAIAEQDDGTNCSLSVMEKLELLRNSQARWAELKWSSQRRYYMQGAGLWELFGNVLAQNTSGGSFDFVQLPSESRKIPERKWMVKPDTPRLVRDFGMDPSQDLLVLIELPQWSAGRMDRPHRIYMRSMSTATKHPLTTGSGLIEHSFYDPNTSYSIKISLDVLAIFFHATNNPSVNEFVIWEWKTGHKKLHLVGDEFGSFCLLSERHVLLSLISELPDGYDQAELLVVDFEQEDYHKKTIVDITHGFKLSLPVFHSSVLLRSFAISSDPSPSWAPQSDLKAPFHASQDAKIFVASIWVQKDALRHLILLIPQNTLLRHKNLLGPISNESTLAWEAWGPQGSRMTEKFSRNPSFEVWACHVYGTRFILSECSARSNQTFTLQVFDFNQRALRKAISQGQRISEIDVLDMDSLECNASVCVTAPNIFPAGDIFREEVKTTLPYRWVSESMPSVHPASSPMCAEDSIIVVDHFREDRGYYHVFTF